MSTKASIVVALGDLGEVYSHLRNKIAQYDLAGELLEFDLPLPIHDAQDPSLKCLQTPLGQLSSLRDLRFAVFHFSGHGSVEHNELVVDIGEEITRETVSRIFSEPERLYKMTALGFERFVAEIYRGLGYRVRTTRRSHDGGVDLYLDYKLHGRDLSFVVQCKYRESPRRALGISTAREFLGTVVDKAVTAGILVTNYIFSGATRKLLASHSSRLFGVDRNGLLHLMTLYLLATAI